MKKALFLSLAIISLFSCKREKVDAIGPDISIASPNFTLLNDFTSYSNYIDFRTEEEWFLTDFNERVSWKITIKGLQSNAEKVITGTSSSINKDNSTWQGGHTGIYFFRAGEDAVAELTIFGSNKTWTDTISVAGERTDFGSNVITWWDMDNPGKASEGTVYWFDFYDSKPNSSINEKVLNAITSTNDPVQNSYRSLIGDNSKGNDPTYTGAISHTALSPYSYPVTTPVGFNAPLGDIYLNFYLRKNTPSAAMGGSITSIITDYDQDLNQDGQPPVVPAEDVLSVLSFNVGNITWDGWKLISIKLSSMTSETGNPPFDPTKIGQIRFDIGVISGVNKVGFDIDYITFTQGAPFDPSKY